MASRFLVVFAAAVATASCALGDPNLSRSSGAPAYMPSNAMPPTLTAAANDLVGPTWLWERTQLPDGRNTVAAAPDRYTLKFEGGGRVLLRADCNRGSGAYEVNGNAMKLGPAALSKMGCPAGTQDTEFAAPLVRVTSYAISDGALVLTLADGGTMRLRATP